MLPSTRSFAWSLLVIVSLVACTLRPTARSGESAGTAPGRLTVLMINGGGTAAGNFQSHLLHVKELVAVLERAGVPKSRITILSGDGPDAAADMALREVQPESDFWLLGGTRLEKALRTPITYESSAVPGFELRAATTAEVDRWFRKTGTKLGRGDTLLLYVTDHGTKNPQDTTDNRIVLWGQRQMLSVNDLRAKLATLDPKVRVVALMSQCYSGSFANLVLPGGGVMATGNVCGYFSTTAERPAYGCYPENFGLENVGHSFHFIGALATDGSFPDAHSETMRADATPDVPLRTSDFYLDRLLHRAATAAGEDYATLVDGLLVQAWQDKAAWEPEIRELDDIGQMFGTFSPRSLAELDQQAKALPNVSAQLSTHGKAWRNALGDANRNNLDRFLAANPTWDQALKPDAIRGLPPGGARKDAAPMIAELARHTDADPSTAARLTTLHAKADKASDTAYRMEVRLGGVLRMRTILTTIAGRVYLAQSGTPEEREEYAALLRCEDLELPLRGTVEATVTAPKPFPPLEEDLQVANEVLPAWMGIQFKDLKEQDREVRKVSSGASTVMLVYPDSPAKAAGLQVGDVITGPPGAPFKDRNQIREWVMTTPVGRPVPLEVLRGSERRRVTLVPKPYPMKWPELPGPPKVSSAAPPMKPLKLTAYRGDVPRDLGEGTPHLLFFWATWCGPCKAALPELVAFEKDRGTPVIAITDEQRDKLDGFFKTFNGPFPERVVTDEYRRSFLAYGVSATPTFVLVDGSGTVRAYSRGYASAKGLGIDGWKWSGTQASARSAP